MGAMQEPDREITIQMQSLCKLAFIAQLQGVAQDTRILENAWRVSMPTSVIAYWAAECCWMLKSFGQMTWTFDECGGY